MKKLNLNEFLNDNELAELSNNVIEDIDGGCTRTNWYKRVSGGVLLFCCSTLSQCSNYHNCSSIKTETGYHPYS